ncbi:hypothetical protein E2C01_017858 [Portunus trituberculatus]|uniref:Uncharacterized protein n=1 Tax=Portunus trituberculatus TaxID=210409 RepID=A0A5B7DUY4_PORTR|nr:hypothetical protein [Portunus trituberculatus]
MSLTCQHPAAVTSGREGRNPQATHTTQPIPRPTVTVTPPHAAAVQFAVVRFSADRQCAPFSRHIQIRLLLIVSSFLSFTAQQAQDVLALVHLIRL